LLIRFTPVFLQTHTHLTATHHNTLRHTATHCNTLQHTVTLPLRVAFAHGTTHPQSYKHTPTSLQHAATHCNTLQHTATHCNTPLTRHVCSLDVPPPHSKHTHRLTAQGVYCSVLQCVAVCCSVWQCVAACCGVLQVSNLPQTHASSILQQWHCTLTLHESLRRRDILQHTATHCSTLQHTATHCNTLQHTATRCNTLRRTKHLAARALRPHTP